jgi:hypothetical protein
MSAFGIAAHLPRVFIALLLIFPYFAFPFSPLFRFNSLSSCMKGSIHIT